MSGGGRDESHENTKHVFKQTNPVPYWSSALPSGKDIQNPETPPENSTIDRTFTK